jgi:hypothetical protein
MQKQSLTMVAQQQICTTESGSFELFKLAEEAAEASRVMAESQELQMG